MSNPNPNPWVFNPDPNHENIYFLQVIRIISTVLKWVALGCSTSQSPK